jgi:hypothetical protein
VNQEVNRIVRDRSDCKLLNPYSGRYLRSDQRRLRTAFRTTAAREKVESLIAKFLSELARPTHPASRRDRQLSTR